MTDPADALLEDILAVPGLTAEVTLAPGATIVAGWRTNGIPLLTADRTGCLPVLTVTYSWRCCPPTRPPRRPCCPSCAS
jgi:hypothetical protein